MKSIITQKGRPIKTSSPKGAPRCELTQLYKFSDGFCEFATEELSGLLEVKNEISKSRLPQIFIDTEYAAHFFKELILAVHGEEIILVKLECQEGYAVCKIVLDKAKMLDKDTVSRLSRLACCAGFNIAFEESITLKTKILYPTFSLIYALGTRKVEKIFDFVMFDLQ